MFSPQCLFCGHVNPAGAKFCNDCGLPLHLKRCSQCEAVNDRAAKNCSKCRTEFPVLATPSEGAANVVSPRHYGRFGSTHRFKPAPSAAKVTAAAQAWVASEPTLGTAGSPAQQLARPAAAIEHDKLDLAFDPQRSTFEDPTPSVRVGSDRELTPEPVSAADIQDVPRRLPGNETAETGEAGPEIVTREARSLGRDVTSLFSAAQRVTAMVPLATAERRPTSRVALVVLLPTIALIAIGVSAYYVYNHSVQLSEGQGAQAVSAAPADVNAGNPPTRPIAKIGVAAPSAPSVSLGTGSVAAIGTAKPASPVEPSTAFATSPASQGTAAATGSNGASRQTPSPNERSRSEPHPQVSTSDQVTHAQQFAAKAEGVVKGPSAATAVAGDLRRTMPAAGNEVTAKRSATNRPMRMYPAASAAGSVQSLLNDSRVNVRPDVPRPAACTEGVAALGLCSLNSRGESK
jgi:Double zinc ribbon